MRLTASKEACFLLWTGKEASFLLWKGRDEPGHDGVDRPARSDQDIYSGGGGDVSITDSRLVESKELLPGGSVIRVDSKEEAIEWVTKHRRCVLL